jgi:aromatic ring-opening dioxygenase catalytic subunit (LigB family)
LRDEGVLIVGAGMSFHNMRGYGRPSSTEPSRQFDAWLAEAVTADPAARSEALMRWADAPSGRFAHPREEHLLPLMIAAGASEAAGERVYSELVMETAISGFRFA